MYPVSVTGGFSKNPKEIPMRKTWLVALCGAAVLLAGCGLVQPSTEIGAVGYKNVGFEKALHYEGPLAIVMPDGNRLETNAGKLDVTNDATRMFDSQLEARRMDYELTLSILDRLVSVGDSAMKYYMQYQQADAGAAGNGGVPVGPAFKDELKQTFLDALREWKSEQDGHTSAPGDAINYENVGFERSGKCDRQLTFVVPAIRYENVGFKRSGYNERQLSLVVPAGG
jgi:hypothetical protein